MSNLGAFIRGNTIVLSFQFYDTSGNIVTPSAANAYLNYTGEAGQAEETLALSLVYGEWTASWDSRNCVGGTVFGYAETSPPVPIAATDFVLVLYANPANLSA